MRTHAPRSPRRPGPPLHPHPHPHLARTPARTHTQIKRDVEQRPDGVNLQDEAYLRKAADRMPDIGRK